MDTQEGQCVVSTRLLEGITWNLTAEGNNLLDVFILPVYLCKASDERRPIATFELLEAAPVCQSADYLSRVDGCGLSKICANTNLKCIYICTYAIFGPSCFLVVTVVTLTFFGVTVLCVIAL